MLGPNVLVYDSFIGLAEAQLDYIVDGLQQIKAQGISKLMIKPTVLRHHNQEVQKHLQTTVFNSGGCKSYYLDANGRNFPILQTEIFLSLSTSRHRGFSRSCPCRLSAWS